MLFVDMCGDVLSWNKTSIGSRNDWVVFAFNGISFRCGLEQERASEIVGIFQLAAVRPRISPGMILAGRRAQNGVSPASS